MVFQTLLKIILELSIHQTTENCEQAMGSHMLKRRYFLVPRICIWRIVSRKVAVRVHRGEYKTFRNS